MTDEQALALARLIRDFKASGARIAREPFDLPTGYTGVTLLLGNAPDFVCGIAPDGRVSS